MITSSTITELAKALVLFQGSIENVTRESKNPFYNSKYADLGTIWSEIRQKLSACGLAIIQSPMTSGVVVTVTTRLIHVSGEFLESDLTLSSVDTTPVKIGSCITYARRYSLSAILGIASDDDDDGMQASTKQPNAEKIQPTAVKHTKIEQIPENTQHQAPQPIILTELEALYNKINENYLMHIKNNIITPGDISATIRAITGKSLKLKDLSFDELEKLDIKMQDLLAFKVSEITKLMEEAK